MSNENLTKKTLADVKAGIPARDAEIEALRKENKELREQIEAIGAGGVNGKLMPGAVSAEPVAWACNPYTVEHTHSLDLLWTKEGERAIESGVISNGTKLYAAPIDAQDQIEDDSIELDRLADYIADTWPMDKKYGMEEICQRLHAMWPGEFMPAAKVDRSPEMQGTPVDETPKLQGQQQPVSGADGLPPLPQGISRHGVIGHDADVYTDAHMRDYARAALAQSPMVDMTPPATARDRWMYEQGRLAERDPRTPGTLAQQDANKVDADRWRAYRSSVAADDAGFLQRALDAFEAMGIEDGKVPSKDQIDAAIDAARKEPGQ